MNVHRPELPPAPQRIRRLPVDRRGYPVPWFVAWIDGEPEFRVVKPNAVADAVQQNRCWICGEKLGRFRAYVIGPMCAVNRVNAEPPSHVDCADYAARACPFLSKPQMRRRENNLPGDAKPAAGEMIRRNPKACAVWIVESRPRTFRVPDGALFDIGEPTEVRWYAHGRPAARAEVEESIATGEPLLREACDSDRDVEGAHRALDQELERVKPLLPA